MKNKLTTLNENLPSNTAWGIETERGVQKAMSEHAKEVSVEFNLWVNYSETGKKFMWDHFYSSKPVYSILSEAYDIFAKEVGL